MNWPSPYHQRRRGEDTSTYAATCQLHSLSHSVPYVNVATSDGVFPPIALADDKDLTPFLEVSFTTQGLGQILWVVQGLVFSSCFTCATG